MSFSIYATVDKHIPLGKVRHGTSNAIGCKDVGDNILVFSWGCVDALSIGRSWLPFLVLLVSRGWDRNGDETCLVP